jgi:fructose-bisphosphate aldolase class II
MLRRAANYGICKINIDTDLRLAMTAEIRKYFVENPAEFDPRKYLSPARDAIKAMVQHKIKNVLNASNQR